MNKAISSIFGSLTSQFHMLPVVHEQGGSPHYQMYELLWDLYYSDVYDRLYRFASDNPTLKSLHAIRNPTYRVVEYYSKHIWPGTLPEALPIITENETLIDPVHKVWKWSNWEHRKQVFARRYALLGDEFIKVAQSDDGERVFLQLISAEHVRDFEVDERDFITYIFTEIPFDERDVTTGERELKYNIEVWDKETQLYRSWTTKRAGMKLKELGAPEEELDFGEFGIEFVPYVRGKFRDVGELRGVGALTLAIRKIWEADLIASALHQRLFRYNKSDWVMTSHGVDSAGRSLPGLDEEEAEKITVGEEILWDLPPGRDLKSLVANIDYRSALAILDSHMDELENDLPELAYYTIRALGSNISGRAVRTMLADSVASALEARGNAEATLIRAHMMALTIGKNAGLFPELQGTYEDGDFEHEFEPRDVIPISDMEIAEADHRKALAASVKVRDLGWSTQQIQRDYELDDETIKKMDLERDVIGDEIGEALIRQFDRGNV